MRLLLDTHLLIWATYRSWLLPQTARDLMSDPANTLIFSSISIWEVAIKRALERADFEVDPIAIRRVLLDHSYEELAFTSEHAFAVSLLPQLHKDPFDRALLAQAMAEGILLLSADGQLERYSGVRRV